MDLAGPRLRYIKQLLKGATIATPTRMEKDNLHKTTQHEVVG